MTAVKFFVPGKPAPQGSKRHVGRGIMVESSKHVGPWRERVALAAHEAAGMTGLNGLFEKGEPISVAIDFVMPRPASTPKRSTPPAVKRPDLDKLVRACLDAVTDVLIPDDSAVVELLAKKRIAEVSDTPGAHISIRSLVPVVPPPKDGITGTSGPLLSAAR